MEDLDHEVGIDRLDHELSKRCTISQDKQRSSRPIFHVWHMQLSIHSQKRGFGCASTPSNAYCTGMCPPRTVQEKVFTCFSKSSDWQYSSSSGHGWEIRRSGLFPSGLLSTTQCPLKAYGDGSSSSSSSRTHSGRSSHRSPATAVIHGSSSSSNSISISNKTCSSKSTTQAVAKQQQW